MIKRTFHRSIFFLGLFVILISCTEEVTITINEDTSGSVPIVSLEDSLGNKLFYVDTADNLRCNDTSLIILSQGVYRNEDFTRTVKIFKDRKPFTGTAIINKPESDEIANFMRFKNGYSNGYSMGIVTHYSGMTNWETIQFDFYDNGYIKATANSDLGALDDENKRVGTWLVVDSTGSLNHRDNISEQDSILVKDTLQVDDFMDYLDCRDTEIAFLYEGYNWKKKSYTINYNHEDYIQTRDGPATKAAKSILWGIVIAYFLGAILFIGLLVLIIVLIVKAINKNT